MLHTAFLLLGIVLFTDEGPKQDDPPIEPVPNQRGLIERIVATGGDAEIVGGHIILVSLRDATDSDFVLLKDLRAVRFLDCAHCKIDGSGLENIAQMKRLESLWLHDNDFKNEYLNYIGDFPRLRILDLENTPINNIGLRRLRNLKSLRQLRLTRTRITDKGMPYLWGLTDLEVLDLSGTKVTFEGVELLKKHLPNTKIWD